jgi:anti-anti-sigma factor
MAVGNTGADAIFLGSDERGHHLQVRGSIRATHCYPLRERLLSRLDQPGPVPAVFADLSECTYMDSTFIGLLVAVDKKLQKRGDGERLHVLRPTPECRDILEQIGLMEFLLIEDRSVPAPTDMADISGGQGKPGADFVLRAHEALMETSEEAKKKFGLLREMLEQKLRGEKPPKDSREG